VTSRCDEPHCPRIILTLLAGWHITPLDVAFVAGLAAFASPVTTWLTARGQRGADRTSRIYTDKLNAYNQVMEDSYRGRAQIESLVEDLDGVAHAAAVKLADELDAKLNNLHTDEPERLSRIAVVAPESVIREHEAFVDAWNAEIARIEGVDRSSSDYATRVKVEADYAASSLSLPLTRLRRAMRDDLYG
jgi:hypothetical protein